MAIVMLSLAVLATAELPGFVSSADAQSWRNEDPSAIVLPGTPGNMTRRDRERQRTGSGGTPGGLFRIFRFEPQRRAGPTPRQSLPGSPRVRQSAPAPAVPRVILPPPKDEDALAVLSIGDEFADQLHVGMVDRLDGERKLESFGFSIPGSGLTNPSASVDWMVEGPQRIEQHEGEIAAVLVALGFSDGRALIDGPRTYEFGTSEWRQFYRNRVTSLALTLLAEGHPVIFVGLPPMADPVRNGEVQIVNQVIEEGVAPTRARFVSVYEAFADENGNYVRAGPSLAGEVVNLRTRDGIFLNRAGREKFAQFAERYVPRPGQEVLEPQVSSVVFEGSSLSEDGVGPVILLTSGFADPTATLLEDADSARPEDEAVRDRLLRGVSTTPPPTRADAFRPPEGALSPEG
ncbi:MAG: DUF459 domain-containing protein [Devosiaceae bacterium]|nr:DUF459 domain-containing protein [Devosiaceae bacterium MH13]